MGKKSQHWAFPAEGYARVGYDTDHKCRATIMNLPITDRYASVGYDTDLKSQAIIKNLPMTDRYAPILWQARKNQHHNRRVRTSLKSRKAAWKTSWGRIPSAVQRLGQETSDPNVDMSAFKKCRNRKAFYRDLKEAIPLHAAPPCGKDVDLRIFVDSNHAGNNTAVTNSFGAKFDACNKARKLCRASEIHFGWWVFHYLVPHTYMVTTCQMWIITNTLSP